jgi:hypothetical protein
VLAAGYIGNGTILAWKGDLPLGGGTSIMLEAWSSGGVTVNMTSVAE